jgi:hypothetical protein
MAWVAAVLAIFLFYKFVERKHKIIFFKVAGATMAILIVIGGAIFAHNFLTAQQEKDAIKISYPSISSKLTKERKIEIANDLFGGVLSNTPLLQNLNADEREFVKTLLYTDVPFESEMRKNLIEASQEEFSANLDIIFEQDPKKKLKLQEKELELEKGRLSAYLKDLPVDREKYNSATDEYFYRYKLYARRQSFLGHSDLIKQYSDALSPSEKFAVDDAESSVYRESENYRHRLSKEGIDSEFSVQICNNKNVPLISYSFYISGFDHDRSTPNAVSQRDQYLSSSVFHGDIIIKPKQCQAITWTDKYNVYDRYEISLVNGKWEESKP